LKNEAVQERMGMEVWLMQRKINSHLNPLMF